LATTQAHGEILQLRDSLSLGWVRLITVPRERGIVFAPQVWTGVHRSVQCRNSGRLASGVQTGAFMYAAIAAARHIAG
jgi:hypothetical protein